MEQEYKVIPISLIDPPKNPVRMSAANARIDELVESIKSQGLLQPITVFPVNGRYETLIGDRRQRACKEAGLQEIPCIVIKDPTTLTQVIRLTENIQREDMSPIEEGASVKDLQDINNWGYKLLAAHLGKSTQWVRDRLALLDIPADVQILVHNKMIGIHHGLQLARIFDENTRKSYSEQVMNEGTSVKTLQWWCDMWVRAQETPGEDRGLFDDPSSLPPTKPTKVRCQLCEDYFEIKELRSIISCVGCLQIIKEAGRGRTTMATDPDLGGGDIDTGVGDTGGAKTK